MRFFFLPKIFSFFASVFARKNTANRGFWAPKTLPKSSQNAFKIDVPKNMRFFIDFCSKMASLQRRRHRFRIGFSNTFCLSGTFLQIAFRMHLGSKKPIKNHPKTRSKPLKNRCQKNAFFNIDFFRFRPRFWRVLDSQVGANLAPKVYAS